MCHGKQSIYVGRRMRKQSIFSVTIMKLSLYFISLWILLFMLIILKIDITDLSINLKVEHLQLILKKNIVPTICGILILLGGIGYVFFIDALNNAKNLPVKIEECQSINYENLSFLATYIIPMVCFPMESRREIFVLFSVIIIIGCIFIKTNLFYTNPSLVLLGFNVYSVCDENKEHLNTDIIIIKGKLKKGDSIKYIKLGDNVFFARRI